MFRTGFFLLVVGLVQLAHAQIDSIELISNVSGVPANGASDAGVISTNGTYVAFRSAATDLVPNDTNGVLDVFRSDTSLQFIERGSVNDAGIQGAEASGEGAERPIAITRDGQFVAFNSDASNLDSNITDSNGLQDIYLYDFVNGRCTRESVYSVFEGDASSSDPTITDDGAFVAFSTASTTFEFDDSNLTADIFVKDRGGEIIQLVSRHTDGTLGDDSSFDSAINADGTFIAFSSDAMNIVDGDTNDRSDIFLRTQGEIPTTTKITRGRSGGQANGDSSSVAISADGRFVVFVSEATNLVANDTNSAKDIFIYDSSSDSIELVSRSVGGGVGNGDSFLPTVSDDGRFVAFLSSATNLIGNDRNGVDDVFVRDRSARKTLRVNLTSSGVASKLPATDAAISPDGGYLVFSSADSTLVTGDTNSASDVFKVKIGTIITPDTPIEDPPEVTVVGDDATIVLQEFSGVSLSEIGASSIGIRATSSRRLNFRYVTTVTGTDAVANERRRRITKRNELTVRDLPAGTYNVSYKVLIRRGTRVRARTDSSPTTSFTVSSS